MWGVPRCDLLPVVGFQLDKSNTGSVFDEARFKIHLEEMGVDQGLSLIHIYVWFSIPIF